MSQFARDDAIYFEFQYLFINSQDPNEMLIKGMLGQDGLLPVFKHAASLCAKLT